MDTDTDDFRPRAYQVELYEQVLHDNVIVYLPTGSGKTFIAVMLIKELSADLHRDNNEGKKHSVFAVRTVPLAVQQAKYIERLTGLSCGSYTGEMNVDSWGKSEWACECTKHQVLVMTAQILYNILCCGYLQLEAINLIIFDECHGAVSDDPMRQIMRLFSFCDDEKRPKVLALTASMLNSNIRREKVTHAIQSLETTFHAKTATVNSWDALHECYASAKEKIVYFEPYNGSDVWTNMMETFNEISKILDCLILENMLNINESSPEFRPRSLNSKLKAILRCISEQYIIGGIYAASKCVLLYLIEIERYKRNSNGTDTLCTLEYVWTELVAVRIKLEKSMPETSELERLQKYTSDKVQKLIYTLKDIYNNKPSSVKFCCIIFVKERLTTRTLYYILKNLHEHSKEFQFLVPDYIHGGTTGEFAEMQEAKCLAKWNNDALHRFRNGTTNCMIATNIIDEGIDIPICSTIIRFDPPLDIRSYIQSKGRARQRNSEFIMLAPTNDTQLLTKYRNYKDVEAYLKEYLTRTNKNRQLPRPEAIKDLLYTTKIEPYVITHKDGSQTVLAETFAIPLINRYCSSLFRSKYIRVSPTWTLYRNDKWFMVSLKLPIASPLKELIFGDYMQSIKAAKRSVAMKTCIKLHDIGELNDELEIEMGEKILRDSSYLFPYWKEEKIREKSDTNGKNKRNYMLEYPKALYGAFPVVEKLAYLHILQMKPMYSVPNENSGMVFRDLLSKTAGYAILSSKELPKLPSFPIFMNVGKVHVSVEVNYRTLILKQTELEELKVFHTLVFDHVLSIMKTFMVFDCYNCENCFLIAPVDEKWEIDWETVQNYQSMRHVTANVPLEFRNRDYDLALVTPNYRGSPGVYVVTQICDALTPESCFPTDDFTSFASYYKIKHGIQIQDMTQPLLEVKAISTKINCIKPRHMSSTKRKRADLDKDLLEHFIPELCTRIIFPSLYWLKATTLPSILHRISQLLVAEDLRMLIVQEAQLGSLVLSSEKEWPELDTVETNEIKEEVEPLQERLEEVMEVIETTPELTGPEIDILSAESEHYPWTADEEPVDLYRDIERIQIIDIEYYCKFMSQTCATELENNHACFQKKPAVLVPDLCIFSVKDTVGPDPVQIMHALTTKTSHDMFNLERLETLGDSYLKFIATLFLYTTFSTSNEGILTQLKGKMIGNRNLYCCGCEKRIPGRLKIDEFTPQNFIPPAYTTFRPLQRLCQTEVSPSVLYELNIPLEERLCGRLSERTLTDIEKIMTEWNAPNTHTGMEHFVGIQTVGEKDVADSVEALTGVYLINMGISGAAKLLSWFGVIPQEVNINKLLNSVEDDPLITVPNERMPWASKIEESLGYTFKNRAYLLQALTHPSYMAGDIMESYQRLEFLGDAILDFLLTTYIYENCGNLSPGELTDLRSALVNNITFACLTTRYGFHTGLLSHAPELYKMLYRFVSFQEERNHVIDDMLLWVLMEEEDCNIAEYVDVPKVLGDIFESIIGAIYIDTGKDLRQVWQIIYSLMHKEIEEFSKNVPINPIRKIYETPGARPIFRNIATEKADSNISMIQLQVIIGGKVKMFYGFGSNKKFAKCAAAKQALKHILYSKS